jgi:Spy/CpxP family protein refolding chaperone
MRSRCLLLWLVVVAASAGPVDAQRTPGPRTDEDRARLEERIRARMGDIIRHRLGLDRAEETRLSEIVQEYESRRRALVASERETRQEIEPLLESGTATDADAAVLIDRMIAFKHQEAELFREEQERLQEVLTPTQVLQLYELRVEIGRRIRALRGGGDDGAENRRRNRPPGPGGERSPVER